MRYRYVAPLVGARIEILWNYLCGLLTSVAPLVGARIEIIKSIEKKQRNLVAPLVGARIEIPVLGCV